MAAGVRAGGWMAPPPGPPDAAPTKCPCLGTYFPDPWRNGGGRDRLQLALHRTFDLDRRFCVFRSNRIVLCSRGGTPRDPPPSGVAGSSHLPRLPRCGSLPAMGTRAPRVRLLGWRVRRGPRRRWIPGRHAGGPGRPVPPRQRKPGSSARASRRLTPHHCRSCVTEGAHEGRRSRKNGIASEA